MKVDHIFEAFGIPEENVQNNDRPVFSPIDGSEVASVQDCNTTELQSRISLSAEAFVNWRSVPAPRRGELVRLLAEELRNNKGLLGELVSVECGKIRSEGLGEVQEMIDICDLAVGLSRQLFGLTIQSERPGHHMRESWHPLGPVGIITAFNFPVAVWAWNAALALVCGNPVLWKPSEKTPLTALAVQKLFERAVAKFGNAPENLSQVVLGGQGIGEALVADIRVPLISATGSTAMGRQVGPKVAERFGRSILELGGNNAIIITQSADLDMAIPAIVFGAVGTCGQRCTSTRRLIVHEEIYSDLIQRLKLAYASISIGDPLNPENLVGPLIDQDAFSAMQNMLDRAKSEGGRVTGGQRVNENEQPAAFYVKPALVEMGAPLDCVQQETFAPILFISTYKSFDEALAIHNGVPQGLSSAIFTMNVREAEQFISVLGSDCGIANVNIGTSGAEIGGAFGGEKETGGGRESGSDAWKGYMRRQTNTVNYSHELPLAQGVDFELRSA